MALYVWVGVGEAPSAEAAVGGFIVIAAVGWQAVRSPGDDVD